MSDHALAMFDQHPEETEENQEEEQLLSTEVVGELQLDSLEEDLANQAISMVLDGAIRRIKEKKTRGEIAKLLHSRLKEEKVSFL